MKRKLVSAMTLMLLLTSMVTVAFNIQPVKASGTIYIRADGSIDPPTAPIQRTHGDDAQVASDFGGTLIGEGTPGFNETSEYLIGSVAVGVVFLQCDGTYDYPFENWTSNEESNVIAEVQVGLANWETCAHHQIPPVNLGFEIVDVHYRVPVSCEPIRHPHTWEEFWIDDAMGYLGYNGNGGYENMTRTYINSLRNQAHTIWSFAIFVVIDSNETGHTRQHGFTDIDPDTGSNWYAWGLFGGPYLVMTYDNGGLGIDEMHRVCAHEVGHIFYATDEYNGRTEYSGYLNVSDVDNSHCLMDNEMEFPPSPGTRGQVGWLDRNSNGIYDVIDTFPKTTLTPYSPDPADSVTLTYTGAVVDVPFPNNNPFGSQRNVTINTITDVEYRIDGGSWLKAQAVDGAFDEAEEDFTFTTPELSAGTHTIEAHGNNSVANIETPCASDIVTIPYCSKGTIYIRGDGSVDPSDAPIQRSGTVYTLTDDILLGVGSFAFDGIVVEKDNIILDGANHSIDGGEGYWNDNGIELSGRSNVTMQNVMVLSFTYGIYVIYCSNIYISRSWIFDNGQAGIELDNCSSIFIHRNSVGWGNSEYNGIGIESYYSSGMNIYGNDISNNNHGFFAYGGLNNAISGNNITRNQYSGVWLSCSSNNTVSGNNMINNSHCGVGLWSSSGNVFFHNNFINNTQQVYTHATVYATVWDDGYLSGGNFWSDYTGIDLKSGPNQDKPGSDGIGDISYIIDANNQDGYPLIHPWSSLPVHNVNTGLGYTAIQEAIDAPETSDGHTMYVDQGIYHEHLVVGKPVKLVGENTDTTIIDGNGVGTVMNVTSSNATVSGFTIRNNGTNCFGICLYHVCGIRIACNTFTDVYDGIFLDLANYSLVENNELLSHKRGGILLTHSFNNTIIDNVVSSDLGQYGINLALSFSNTIAYNNVSSQTLFGIRVAWSRYNVLLGNKVTDCDTGIELYNYGENNTLLDNAISNNNVGIELSRYSNYNTIVNNTISLSRNCGIRIPPPDSGNSECVGNLIFHNCFINNTQQAYAANSANIWDDGYPSGGNYWSDYDRPDFFNGAFQNQTGTDGVGDISYTIDTVNQDHYPLMRPWGSLIGDVNGDGYVGIDDIFAVASRFGREKGDPDYSRIYDINGDGYIGIDDIFIAASNFGEENP